MIKVFISYDHCDAELAQRLVSDLRARGYIVDLPYEILQAGDRLGEVITRAINNSDVVIALVSDSYESNLNVSMELSLAVYRQSRGKLRRIVPVVTADGARIPPLIQDLMYLKASNFTYQGLLEKLDDVLSDTARPSQVERTTQFEALREQSLALEHEKAIELLSRRAREIRSQARVMGGLIVISVCLLISAFVLRIAGKIPDLAIAYSSAFASTGILVSEVLVFIQIRRLEQTFHKISGSPKEKSDE